MMRTFLPGFPPSYARTSCRLLSVSYAVLFLFAVTLTAATSLPMNSTSPSASRPRALVYRGPASGKGLSEAVAQLLISSPSNFDVQYAGPREKVDVTPDSLRTVVLYAHPGGPDLFEAWTLTKGYAPAIRDFVSRGGRYMGFCLGAYLAGHTPGYGLLPAGADTDSENDQKGAQVTSDRDTVIQVDWRFSTGSKAGQVAPGQWVYFQEGAAILGLRESDKNFALGRYSKSGNVACSLTKYGDGWVGLIGVHPEATQEWFDAENIRSPQGLQFEMGYDLVEATMAGGQNISRVLTPFSSTSNAGRIRSPLGRLISSFTRSK